MRKIGIPGCVLTLALLGLSPLGGCKSKIDSEEVATPEFRRAEAGVAPNARDRGGAAEAIRVKGDWKITVKNPDETVAAERSFRNALHPSGADAIAGLLGGTRATQGWRVDTSGTTLQDSRYVCQTNIPNGFVGCHSTNLQVEVITGGLRLTGSYIQDSDATLKGVRTTFIQCDGDVSASDCAANQAAVVDSFIFTHHSFSDVGEPNIPVVAGQQVLISVEITFVST